MKIAILGAECTGKTQLMRALAALLAPAHANVVCVPEYLRTWCDTHARTPNANEQSHIAQMQMHAVCAHPSATLLLSDTAPLMTAIYSDLVFGDPSLYADAVDQHRAFGLTLVTGMDLPWQADGIQRDGVAMRTRVDQRLREVLLQHGISFATVYGCGEARSQCALQAIRYALGKPPSDTQRSRWKWPCEKCSDPECEHRLFSALLPKA
jgi:nicotinamide riboside kinase